MTLLDSRVSTVFQQCSGPPPGPAPQPAATTICRTWSTTPKVNSRLEGRLPTDRPHVFACTVPTVHEFGTEIGGFFYGAAALR